MKELATLALVVLPLGMTIVEILAGGDTSAVPEQRDPNIGVHAVPGRGATQAPAVQESRTGTGRSVSPRPSAASDEHAVPGKPA